MMKFFKTIDGSLGACDAYEAGVWVYLINPSEEEIKQTCVLTEIDEELIRPALDEEERPRIETDNGQTSYSSISRRARTTGRPTYFQRSRWASCTQEKPSSPFA